MTLAQDNADASDGPFLTVSHLTFAYPGGPAVLKDINLQLHRGEVVALLGPNGSGKTTLLHSALGLWSTPAGTISWNHQPLTHYSRRQLAQQTTLVAQQMQGTFDFTVRDLVAMGRFAYRKRFDPEQHADTEAIQQALQRTELLPLADRPYPQLSGGEQQRVHLARAFAQQTVGLMLDEPIANLDLRHQWHLLQLVRQHADQGGAVLMSLHDLALAGQFADRLMVLDQGQCVALGPPENVLTPDVLDSVFGMHCEVKHHAQTGQWSILPLGLAESSFAHED